MKKLLIILGLFTIIFVNFPKSLSAQDSIIIGPKIIPMGKVTIDYSIPVADLLSARNIGNYFETITQYRMLESKLNGKVSTEFVLFEATREITSNDMLFWMKKNNCHPADPYQTITFYVKKADLFYSDTNSIRIVSIDSGFILKDKQFRNEFFTLHTGSKSLGEADVWFEPPYSFNDFENDCFEPGMMFLGFKEIKNKSKKH